jgi:FkbM family methyltransferase
MGWSIGLSAVLRYARWGGTLGGDVRSRCLLATLLPRMKCLSTLRLDSSRPTSAVVRLEYADVESRKTKLRFRIEDVFILHEVLAGNPYVKIIAADLSPRHILDLGAHIGLAALQFKIAFPGARIDCFEPNPQSFALLKSNTSGLKGIAVYQAAVAAQAGRTVLYLRPHAPASSSLLRRSPEAWAVECETKRLDDILSEVVCRI